jgi:CheY-like chemotaxis protein
MTTVYPAWPEVQSRCPAGALRSIKTFGRARPHVLIVDDHPASRAICTAYCDLFDFSAEAVSTGAEAIEAAKRTRFDIILMDLDMPGTDSFEATRAIRSLRGPAAYTPVIGVTAWAVIDEDGCYRERGLWSVVAKPITASRLFAAMNAALWTTAPEPRSWAPRKLAS